MKLTHHTTFLNHNHSWAYSRMYYKHRKRNCHIDKITLKYKRKLFEIVTEQKLDNVEQQSRTYNGIMNME